MKHLYSLLMILIAVPAFSQTLEGVVHTRKKEPLPDAYVLLLGTDDHAHTNGLGHYKMKQAEVGDTLLIRHLGYESKRVVVEKLESQLNTTLLESNIELSEITISPSVNSINVITDIDLETKPVRSSQEVLRAVPGLFIAQHGGGGKAEQIFLRGFDIDHGTDVSINVDGMPVNMVSHAHGQGYSDLHFLIPEVIDEVDFDKGPYSPEHGNFATAGYADFKTKDRLESSAVQFGFGQFNTQRALGMFNLVNTDKHSAYIATSYEQTDGPFDASQNFDRLNLMGKYTGHLNDFDKISFKVSHFNSKWNQSGQIPLRALPEIGRFGAIDNTEGGNTSRTNFNLGYNKYLNENTFIKNNFYYSHYDFELFSNFTFFLEDSVNGDQIHQREDRELYGGQSEWNKLIELGDNSNLHIRAAGGFRKDNVEGDELSHTVNRRTTLDTLQFGDVDETNLFTYLDAEFKLGNWLLAPSLRLDNFEHQYNDRLAKKYEVHSVTKTILSPKLNIAYDVSAQVQLYLKGGKGFHSNDTRVVVAQNGHKVLPAAYGSDLGAIWKPTPRVLVQAAVWYLYLEQEFVYVGDAGLVEPSGETARQGIDFSLRYQPLSWLYFDTDMTFTEATALDAEAGADNIPLAPEFTATGGLSVKHPSGAYGGVHVRYLGDRPATPDNSIVAEGYLVTDMNVGYSFEHLDLELAVKNLFDTQWREAQFAYESRLRGESKGVTDIHFTPGTPFYARAVARYRF